MKGFLFKKKRLITFQPVERQNDSQPGGLSQELDEERFRRPLKILYPHVQSARLPWWMRLTIVISHNKQIVNIMKHEDEHVQSAKLPCRSVNTYDKY